MEKMKQIESKDDFLKWAHNVNLHIESKKNGICDLQDVFYRGQDGEMKNLKEWFLDSTQTEKQPLTFSIMKAMGEEMTYKFIKSWAHRQADKCIEEYEKEYTVRENKLYENEKALNKERSEYESKLEYAKKEIQGLNDLLDNSRTNNDGLHQTITRLQKDITQLSIDLDNAYIEIAKVQTFKKTLKEIINPENLSDEFFRAVRANE